MPARSEWKGFLQVNQLQVAVKGFSAATTEPDIVLNQLHRDCGERIRQPRICPIHGLVESDSIVPGYQIADNFYIPLEKDEIDQLRPDPDKSISVECFVDSQLIDPVFHTGRTLYLVPDGPPGQRPFSVIREGLKLKGRHAFSRVVLSGREKLVLVRPYGRLLAMTVVEYPHRVRLPADYESEVATVTPGPAELGLIEQLIESLTDHTFDLSRYRDRYMDALSRLIEERIAATDVMQSNGPREDVPTDDAALLAILKSSLVTAGVAGTGLNGTLDIPVTRFDETDYHEQKTA